MAQVRGFFDRALTADPGNVDAFVGSALADLRAGAAPFSVADPMALEVDQDLCPREHTRNLPAVLLRRGVPEE